MTHAIRAHEAGGPDVLRWEEVTVGEPGAGEVRVRHRAVGVNFIDVYQRSGLYPVTRPYTPGTEAAGVVEAVGEGVTHLRVGDRVGYATGPLGAYSEARLVPAERLVVLPVAIADDVAAAMMLKGMTAEYLARRILPLTAGDVALVHAAAGGVGLILCQWLAHLGVTVIGTAGSDEKAAMARTHGATHTIVYTRDDFVARVKELTSGAGVRVVYDSVGRDTFLRSLDCIRPRGMMVSFGQSSGAIAPFDPLVLSQKGSLFLTRPTLFTYAAARDDLVRSAKALFDVVGRGAVKIEIGQRFALRDAADAHRALESRATHGATVLTL